MKFLKPFSFATLALVLLLLASCKKAPAGSATEALNRIPSNANNVTAIDLKSMMQKADFEAVKQMDFYKEMVSETQANDPTAAKVLLDPASSGVNLDGKIYIATAMTGETAEEFVSYVCVPLKDAKAFEALFQNGKAKVVEKEGIKFLEEAGTSTVGWTETMAIIVTSNSETGNEQQAIINAFKQDPKTSIGSNASAVKTLSDKHDINTWMSADDLLAKSGAGMALSMLDIDNDALKGNSVTGYADFETGKMVGHSDFNINKKLGEGFIGRFFKKEATADFSKALPKDAPTFVTVLALDLVGIDKFLSEQPQTKQYADFAMNDLGVKRQDLMEALGGDIMVAGFGEKSLEESNMIVSMSLKNEAKAKEILQAAVKAGKLKDLGNGVYTMASFGNDDFNVTVNNGYGRLVAKNGLLTFSTDDALLDKVIAGETGGSGTAVLKSFNNQTLAGWFDFQSLWDVMGGSETKSFKHMDFKVNGKGADFILETADPNANALKSFFQMIDEGYKQRDGVMPQEAL